MLWIKPQVALEYKAAIDMWFEFYENQVARNNKLCSTVKELNE